MVLITGHSYCINPKAHSQSMFALRMHVHAPNPCSRCQSKFRLPIHVHAANPCSHNVQGTVIALIPKRTPNPCSHSQSMFTLPIHVQAPNPCSRCQSMFAQRPWCNNVFYNVTACHYHSKKKEGNLRAFMDRLQFLVM